MKSTHATVFGLVGPLGAGKTTFVKKFVEACGIGNVVTSPTFVILKKYGNIIHIDAYRLKDSSELLALRFKELLENPEHVIFIEWADRVTDILPPDTFMMYFHHVDEQTRKISID